MTSAEVRVLRPSPWLSVWFSPRKTIERIVATNPRRHVLLLAGLGAMGTVIAVLIGRGAATELMDWGGLASVAIVGLVLGVVGLYINGLAYMWSGRIPGGRATYGDVRAVFAAAAMPDIIGRALCLVVQMGVKLAGTSKPASSG